MNPKNHIFIFFIFFGLLLSAQDRDAFQPDSVYKANKVKLCKVIESGGWHYSTTHFDHNGRIVRLVKYDNSDPSNYGAYFTEISTYYLYADDGRLIHMIDSVKTRMPTPEESEKIRTTGPIGNDFVDKLNETPPLEINTYELVYENEEMVLTNKFDPKESLLYVDSISKNGYQHKKYSYTDRVLDQVEFISYSQRGYPCRRVIQVPNEGYWFWNEYNLTYEFQGGRLTIVTGVRDDGEVAETQYFYNESGLATKRLVGSFGYDQYSEQLYTYEYYE